MIPFEQRDYIEYLKKKKNGKGCVRCFIAPEGICVGFVGGKKSSEGVKFGWRVWVAVEVDDIAEAHASKFGKLHAKISLPREGSWVWLASVWIWHLEVLSLHLSARPHWHPMPCRHNDLKNKQSYMVIIAANEQVGEVELGRWETASRRAQPRQWWWRH